MMISENIFLFNSSLRYPKVRLQAIFVALLYAAFVAPEFRDENRKCKLAAISMRFVSTMQRFQT